MSVLNRFLTRTKTLGADSLQLVSAVVRSPCRETLMEQAKQANSVATNMLLMEKEVGLVRYYGLTGYLREKRHVLPTWLVGRNQLNGETARLENADSTLRDSSSRSTTSSSLKSASVSFMITASQRDELFKLEYSEQEIKKLKPIEAALILDYNLHPSNAPERLPALVKEHEDALIKAKMEAIEQHKREEQERLQQEQETFMEAAAKLDDAEHELNETVPMHEEDFVMTATREWYAVVETKPDGEATTVGLYSAQEEAKICLEAKEYFAQKYSKSKVEQPTYEIQLQER